MSKAIKTAKGRKLSSTRWLQRQLNDEFVARAKKDGYRSRAAYKLIEAHERFDLFKSGQSILDLGSAPGSWSQVSAQLSRNSDIIAIDLLEMQSLPGVTFIQNDFLDITDQLLEKRFHLILSDIAPNTIGNKDVDHYRIMDICESVIEFSLNHMIEGGAIIMKAFAGSDLDAFVNDAKKHFDVCKRFKPVASRSNSSELYLIFLGFTR